MPCVFGGAKEVFELDEVANTFHCDSKVHFMQFRGLIEGNMELANKQHIVWYAILWNIWISRNELIFHNKQMSTDQIIEKAQVTVWFWLKGNVEGFVYPLQNWMANPVTCLRSHAYLK